MLGQVGDGHFIQWTANFLADRTIEMAMEGNGIGIPPVEAEIPQGSLVSPIVFSIYTSGIRQWVKERVSGIEGISCAGDVGWMATGSDVSPGVRKLESCARESIDWAERRELEFHTSKTEAALFIHRRGHMKHVNRKLLPKIGVANGFVRYNKEVTRLLGDWMDAHQAFKVHPNRCMKKARATEARLRLLTRTY